MARESKSNGWSAIMVIAGTNKRASKRSLAPITIASLLTTKKHFDWAVLVLALIHPWISSSYCYIYMTLYIFLFLLTLDSEYCIVIIVDNYLIIVL